MLWMRKLARALAAAGGAGILAVVAAGMWAGRLEDYGASPAAFAAGTLLLASLALFLARQAGRFSPSARWAGNTVLHAGLFLAVGAFMLNEALGDRGLVYIREGTESAVFVDRQGRDQPLPFVLGLEDFRAQPYPGTLRAKSYSSQLRVRDRKTQKETEVTLSVNAPAELEGFRLYQHDCGIEPGPAAEVRLTVSRGRGVGGDAVEPGDYTLMPGRTVEIGLGAKVSLLDFSPTLVFRKAGEPMTARNDAMLNPAYLVRVEIEGREPETRWVLPADPDSGVFGPALLSFTDFFGIEYSVLSVVRHPFDGWVHAGCLLAALGAAALVFGRKRP